MYKLLSVLLFFICGQCFAQNPVVAQQRIQRPKLVVGIVVDQMRWDYLYRYYDRYSATGGFKRLLSQGFSCENTIIPYTPTLTANGHASIFTGSVPAINGITGNDWWDNQLNKIVYCTEDTAVRTIGSNTANGKMSPRNLRVTTIGDELRLASNFKSKVFGIALKDRGAILAAGHSGNAAYWFDLQTGDWISSSYYMNDLPQWVKDFNGAKLPDKYYQEDWKPLFPISTYTQSTSDQQVFEIVPFGSKTFPYNLKQFAGKNYNVFPVTPYGNTLSFDLAKATIAGENLGTGEFPDMLAISLSTPDYIGHNFGPNSIEAEDGFLRLDRDLGNFLDHLDEKLGKGSYLLFLTADHGVIHVPEYLKQNKIPATNVRTDYMETELSNFLKERFKGKELLIGIFNSQVYLDNLMISSSRLNREEVLNYALGFIQKQQGVDRAFLSEQISTVNLSPFLKEIYSNSYFPSRSGEIQIIYRPHFIEGFQDGGTTHGAWNPYDSHIPLIWYGWNIRSGSTNARVLMTDIAPTVSSLLHIQMPSGSIGSVIEELKK